MLEMNAGVTIVATLWLLDTQGAQDVQASTSFVLCWLLSSVGVDDRQHAPNYVANGSSGIYYVKVDWGLEEQARKQMTAGVPVSGRIFWHFKPNEDVTVCKDI